MTAPTLRADFNRRTGLTRCGKLEVKTHGASLRPLCRALTKAGYGGHRLRAYDERGMLCLIVHSVQGFAAAPKSEEAA